jgi:hypothetical protein
VHNVESTDYPITHSSCASSPPHQPPRSLSLKSERPLQSKYTNIYDLQIVVRQGSREGRRLGMRSTWRASRTCTLMRKQGCSPAWRCTLVMQRGRGCARAGSMRRGSAMWGCSTMVSVARNPTQRHGVTQSRIRRRGSATSGWHRDSPPARAWH